MTLHRPALLLLLLGWMLPGLWTVAAGAQLLRPYSAEYILHMGSFVVGKVEISLDISPKGEYTYRAYTIPAGLATLFRNDEITEISKGKIEDGRVTPINYFYHHIKRKKVRKVNLDFDWSNHRVSNRMKESSWSMDIPNGVQDKFSQQLALMMHLVRNSDNLSLQVADGGRLKTYHFKRQNQTQISVKAGSYKVVKLTHAKDDRPSRATFWMAPDLYYLPIKVVKQEKDGEFTVELKSIAWKSAG
ncbi:MAG: DUF3108 domain-containing protein [Sedimenticola sp.]